LKVLEYLYENGCPISEEAFKNAVRVGNLDVLKYLMKCKPEFKCKLFCNMAARYGHLEILKYLHHNGCSWDDGDEKSENDFVGLLAWEWLPSEQ